MFSSKLPQKRHPERSAAQIYRVNAALVARSRRTPTGLILPMLLGAFVSAQAAPRRLVTAFPWVGEKELLASCVAQQILFSGFGGRKAPSSMGKISPVGVL